MSNAVTTRNSLVPTTLSEAMQFSDVLSKSIMVPREYQGKPANVLVAVQWGMELGLAPMQALQNIAVINGKPSIYGDALLAMVRADHRCRGVKEYLDKETAVCLITRSHNAGEVEEIERKFSVDDAKRAGLWGKQGPWKQYPQRMLQMRARSLAIRDGFPDVIKGLISVEEAQDMPAPMKPVQPQPAPSGPTIAERAMAAIEPPQEAVEAPQAPPEPVEGFALRIPGKPTQSFTVQMDFADAYNDLLLKVRRARSLPEAERRTKMKALEEANADTFAMLDEDLAKELRDKRLQYNAGLGAEEKEASND
ncbi:hypothetical protein N9C56_00115 [Paracoccaceae bacterium]|nr:hypothetical protein [Paracoccaceae bacterium]